MLIWKGTKRYRQLHERIGEQVVQRVADDDSFTAARSMFWGKIITQALGRMFEQSFVDHRVLRYWKTVQKHDLVERCR